MTFMRPLTNKSLSQSISILLATTAFTATVSVSNLIFHFLSRRFLFSSNIYIFVPANISRLDKKLPLPKYVGMSRALERRKKKGGSICLSIWNFALVAIRFVRDFFIDRQMRKNQVESQSGP